MEKNKLLVADLESRNVPNHDASLCTAGVRHLLAKKTKGAGKIQVIGIRIHPSIFLTR